MLQKLEMYEIQDKGRLLEEMNETREAVNEALASVDKLSQDDKDLKRIVKMLEERLVKLEDNIKDLMKEPEAEPKPKPTRKKQ